MISTRMAEVIERVKKDAEANAGFLAQPKPEPPVRVIPPERPAVIPPPMIPFGRLYAFGATIVLQPNRVMRFLTWAYMLPWRGSELLRVLRSGRIDDDAYEKRMEACRACRQAIIRMTRGGKEPTYCQQCGCPKWRLAELRTKNRFKGWECPARKHDGPYRSDAWKDRYMELTGRSDDRRIGLPIVNGNGQTPPAQKRGGCGGT